jgi:hypothetical protein
MAAFVILAPPTNQILKAVIERDFPRRYFIEPGQWVVAETNLTAQQVSEKIGGLDGSKGSYAVFSVAGFFGHHNKTLWEWLTLNSG